MKRKQLFLVFPLVVLCTIFTGSLFAQTQLPTAEIEVAGGPIQLDTDEPLAETYELDISDYNFQNQLQLDKFISMYEKDYVTFVYQWGDSTVEIELDLQATQTQDWTVTDWNNYLKN